MIPKLSKLTDIQVEIPVQVTVQNGYLLIIYTLEIITKKFNVKSYRFWIIPF